MDDKYCLSQVLGEYSTHKVWNVVHNDQNLLIRDVSKAKTEQIIDVFQKQINDEDA